MTAPSRSMTEPGSSLSLPVPELGVVGWPLKRTFSPPMQQCALRHAGLEWSYGALAVPPDEIDRFLSVEAALMRGFNVTMPYKRAVQAECFWLDELSRVSGTVNTVVVEDGPAPGAAPGAVPRLRGYNTDAPGLLSALDAGAGFSAAGSSVLILGAGGAASACAAAMGKSGATAVTVANRTVSHAVTLAAQMAAPFPKTLWSALPLDRPGALSPGWPRRSGFDLVVNCIPEEHSSPLAAVLANLGGHSTVFCDLAYGEAPTGLITAARGLGMRVVSGLDVLLWQGALAFEIFTGRTAPVEVMREALTGVAGRWWL